MKDYLVRATAANAQIRAFAVTSRALVEEARRIHNTSPVVTAGLEGGEGRAHHADSL